MRGSPGRWRPRTVPVEMFAALVMNQASISTLPGPQSEPRTGFRDCSETLLKPPIFRTALEASSSPNSA